MWNLSGVAANIVQVHACCPSKAEEMVASPLIFLSLVL